MAAAESTSFVPAVGACNDRPVHDARSQQAVPQPPFTVQEQPGAGLAQKMDPEPDHGEDTYRGTGRLTGRKALVTVADSGIGRAVAIAFAREGADVVLSYLPSEQPDADEVITLVEQAGRKTVAAPGDLKDRAYCDELVATTIAELAESICSSTSRVSSSSSPTSLI